MLKPGRPRHEQLSDWLREQIEQGVYEVDSRLPSESQLGKRFGVSRITVRRALQTLENEGLIYRRQGLGSFVRDQRVRQGLVRLTDFVEDMTQAGLTPSSQVLFHGPVPAPPEVARALGLDEGTTVIRLDRRRLGNGEPVAFDRTWLPVFYAQLLEGHDLETETIYHILEHNYGVPVLRGRYRIEAVNADAELAATLGVAEGRALLLITRLSTTHGDRHIYYQQRYYRSDRVAYELELERDPRRLPSAAHGLPLRDFEPVFNL
ncbi:GntR family transcriptional regulator [Rhodocaloribacter litoris]|uniref:GntR family transcriptional regulator n=1 Tax=Rhodocaloribacter litoris TaxID=2558931 RepID=UPI0014238A91|nr:GntR family transcriptional regulator [Rhodocaloribacter litoris]QXD13963.1 GntR family transcriptional regulator [Rhodocaloribacter litoris]